MRLAALRMECRQRYDNLSKLRSPRALDERVKKMTTLMPMDPQQVIHLAEPVSKALVER
jgi:hypothetical protein